jgi:perosamine synthetase
LADIAGVGLQPVAPWASPAAWLFCVTIDPERYGRSRDELAAELDAAEIETRPFFFPLHRLPPYEQRPGAARALPVTDALSAAGLNLPTYPQMTIADVERVTDAIREASR